MVIEVIQPESEIEKVPLVSRLFIFQQNRSPTIQGEGKENGATKENLGKGSCNKVKSKILATEPSGSLVPFWSSALKHQRIAQHKIMLSHLIFHLVECS